MLKDYAEVAQQARLWSQDAILAPRKRLLARNLSELAAILSDAQYGCPAEHDAAELMYCTLCKSVAERSCRGRADCPHRRQASE